ncbi:MAG: TolC family protein [Deltaproteobacteria bacterium]|nr:TolC family protein [Deltaproteobacteria bacterium]
MTRKIIFLVFLLLPGIPLPAVETACVIASTQDILACALKNHPDIIRSETAAERDHMLVKMARQRPNPEITSKVVTGTNDSPVNLATETTLFHTLELGWKRGARIHQARALGELADAGLLETREEVSFNMVLALNRLRQIRAEKEFLAEAVSTFGKIIRQFKSRSLLPPEQEISLSVFEVARGDYELQKNVLLDDERELITFVELGTGTSFDKIKKFLPNPKKRWPEIVDKAGEGKASAIQKAEAELKKAKASLQAARRDIWPDMKMGPTVETEKRGRETEWIAGGSVSFPIPLLSLNSGTRAFARLDRAQAKSGLETVLKKTAFERANALQRYRASVADLSRVKTGLEKHRRIEALFEKGFVSSPLVIEAHRQLIDTTKNIHQREIVALEALWRIYIIDGTVFGEKI